MKFIVIALLYSSYWLVVDCTACKSSPCMYGICVDEQQQPSLQSSYRCYCIDGYTGVNCEINWDDCWSNPCLNGGTCNDAIAAYNCTCPERFVGVNCEQRYSECSSQPCRNNASCSDDDGQLICHCNDGFSGEFCEIDASVCNSSVCHNGAECIDGPGLTFSCRCADGWQGEHCQLDVNECELSTCQNGGLCINSEGNYQCICLFGFTGRDCEKKLVNCDDNICQNGAVCLLEDGHERCYCVPDYHGQYCELKYDDCESKNARCQNGATCVDGINDYSCECPAPYTGDTCVSTMTSSTTTTMTTNVEDVGDESTLSSTTIVNGEIESRTEYPVVMTSTESSSSNVTTSNTGETSAFAASASVEATTMWTTSTTISSISSAANVTSILSTGSKTDEDYHETTTSITDLTSTTTPTIFTTITSSDTSPASSAAATASVVTMIPASISSPTIIPVSVSSTDFKGDDEFERPTSTSTTTTTTTTTTSTSTELPVTDDYFTSVNDFHRTTFGSDIDVATLTTTTVAATASDAGITDYQQQITTTTTTDTSSATTASSSNTTRCVQDPSQCDCSNFAENCNNSNKSSVISAAFNGRSYIRQKFEFTKTGILSILLRLKTRAKSGLLIHALFDDERYVLLYLESNQLKFQFSCGLQTMLFGELDSPVNNGHDVDLEMRFEYLTVEDEQNSAKCSARLLVNGTVAMSGEQLLQAHDTTMPAPRYARLHLGGIPVAFSRQLPQIVLGFVGCMSLLKVNGNERDFVRDSVEAVQIEECRAFACLSNPCKNFGACEELDDGSIECRCSAGYSGEFCERSICDNDPCHVGATCLMSPGVDFVCVCPLGAHGLFCEKDTTILQPSFSLFAPGFSSYVAYGLSASLKDSMELKMRIIPQNLEQISLIAYVGGGQSSGTSSTAKKSSDHLSVTYVRGYIMLTWDLGSGVRRIFTSSPINSRARKAHVIQVGRRGRDSWLYVDGIGNVTGRAAGTSTRLDVSPILYIGGHKSKYFDSLPHDLPLHTGFAGCIYDIELHTDDNVSPAPAITMANSPATGRGIGECHRNECSHHSCKNGAVCLNYGPTYSCVCMKDWQGPDCSYPINCTTANNNNNNNNNNYSTCHYQ